MKPIAAKTLKMIQYIKDHPETTVRKLMAKFKVSQATVYKVRQRAKQELFDQETTPKKLYVPLAAARIAQKLGLSVEEYVKQMRKANPTAFEETNDLTPQEDDEPTKVDTILDQRATQYGKFIEGAEVMQTLKQVVRTSIQKRGTALAFDQLESIDMIIHKLGRVINGNPDNVDSWRDIAGYATLVADRLEGNVR